MKSPFRGQDMATQRLDLDVISFSSLINAYAQSQHWQRALEAWAGTWPRSGVGVPCSWLLNGKHVAFFASCGLVVEINPHLTAED